MKKVYMLLFCLLLLIGCDNKNDNLRFKEEYESLNDELISVDIPSDNYIKYVEKEDIISMIDEKESFVLYVGDQNDDESRQMVPVLIEAADSTDLSTIYYLNDTDLSFLGDYVVEPEIPLVLFVFEGEIKSYHIGIGNNEVLSGTEREDLFNTYLDGIHLVLNDICNEECSD